MSGFEKRQLFKIQLNAFVSAHSFFLELFSLYAAIIFSSQTFGESSSEHISFRSEQNFFLSLSNVWDLWQCSMAIQ
jgi:hypothetical protein